MQEQLYELIIAGQQKQEMQRVLSYNEITIQYGITLTEEEVKQLMVSRNNCLKEQKRVEFGESILPKLIEVFCDSDYINKEEYTELLEQLQELFYIYKNESMDYLTDDELLHFIKEQFDTVCFGSIEYLGDTCLERFCRAIRYGYRNYQKTEGFGEYETFSEEQRWDRELFYEVLKELVWE